MKLDFSKDIVVSFNKTAIVIKIYEKYGKEELEETLNKLLILRGDPEHKGFKIIGMNIAKFVDLPITPKMVTKCFLKNEENEIVTDSLELDILSIEEAEKCAGVENDQVRWLKFFGAESKEERDKIADGNEVLMELAIKIEELKNDEEFKEILKNEQTNNKR